VKPQADVPPALRVVIHAAFVLTGAVNTVLGPLLPWLSARWALSDSAAGFLFTIQFVGGLAGGTASGRVVSKVGEARTLSAGFALMTGGMLALAFGGHAAGLMGVGASGIGLGLVIPTTNLLIARLEAHRAAAALGALNLAWGLGAVLWPLAVAASGPLTGARWALGALSALLVAAALRLGRLVPPKAAPIDTGAPASLNIAIARIALFGLMLVLYVGTEAALGGWMAELARRVGGQTPTVHWAFAVTAFWGGLVAGRAAVAVGLSARREDAAALAGLALAICSVVVLLLAPGPLAITTAAALAGVGLAPVFPVTVAALSREVSPQVGGPLIALGGLGGATIPWLVGAVSDRTGSLESGLRALLGISIVLLGLHVVRMLKQRSPEQRSR